MQQPKSTETQNAVSQERNVYENRRLDSVRKNFAVGLKKDLTSRVINGDPLDLKDRARTNQVFSAAR